MTTTSPADHRHEGVPVRPRVVLATENQGKVRELRTLIGDIADVLDLRAFGISLPEETGTSFRENALAKADYAARATGLVAVADDSGLEVAALAGAPGVRTARYAGEDASDADNRSKLLATMREVSGPERGARFVSVIALVDPAMSAVTKTGTCEGAIAFAERGDGGFGYDSLFLLADGRTMAELSPEEKNAISHRGMAMREAVPVLREMLVAEKSQSC